LLIDFFLSPEPERERERERERETDRETERISSGCFCHYLLVKSGGRGDLGE
jgi:hypothetical protein